MKKITKLNLVRRISQMTYLSGGIYLSLLAPNKIQIIYLMILVIAATTYGFSLSQSIEHLKKTNSKDK